MLRLTGAPLGGLRRVVALESAVPLLAVAAVAIGVGFGVSAMYVTTQVAHPLVPPTPRTSGSPRPESWSPSASSRPRSRCCGASPALRRPETNDPPQGPNTESWRDTEDLQTPAWRAA